MKSEPLKGKIGKAIILDMRELDKDCDQQYVAIKTKEDVGLIIDDIVEIDDIRSSVEWLKEEMKFWFGTGTDPTLLKIQKKIDKAFEDVMHDGKEKER